MRHRPLLFTASCALAVLSSSLAIRAQDAPKPATPPVAKQVPHTEQWHGRAFEDPWFWLREKQNPDVVAYLEAENAFTDANTKELQPLQKKLYDEVIARVKQTDLQVPVRDGKHWYYTRTVEGQQYPLTCRRPAAADGSYDERAAEQVLLDPNAMAKGSYLGIDEVQVSDDGTLLAYTTDTTGFRQYTLHVKDLRTGDVRADLAKRVTAVQWAADGKTLFFVTEDETTKRSNQVWRLELGGAPVHVWEEKDELFRIGMFRTRDDRYVMLGSFSNDTAEMRYLDAAKPNDDFRTVLPRRKGHRYRCEHREGSWFVVSDASAPNFRVVQMPVGSSDIASGKEIVAHRTDVYVADFDVFAAHAVVQERKDGLTRFRVLDFASGQWRDIAFPESVYAAFAGDTREFTSPTFRVSYQSMVTPPCVDDYDLRTLQRERKKQTEVIGYDSKLYRTERLWATARDGTKVPLSIVYREGRARDGKGPLWLYGYGSYGAPMPAAFDVARVSLLDRGFVWATAHIRGGSELGDHWHKGGMLMNKKNTFFDFVDCAEYLIAEKWTSAATLVAEGGSAGGLLMGAVANLRPDLFAAIHSAVPFVDVMNTMMDASLPLTVGEYLEWGNPNEKSAFEYMLSYSPYENLAAKRYPATLVTTSFNDSQVMYWEPAKYVAKLRTLLPGDQQRLLLKCKLEAAGHGGASGRYDRWRDRAFEMAWMCRQVGVAD